MVLRIFTIIFGIYIFFFFFFLVFTFLKGALLEMQIEILKNAMIRYLRFAEKLLRSWCWVMCENTVETRLTNELIIVKAG